jgi:signal transduction histidine kinase
MVSHELRTPLNSINGFLEIVLEGQVGALNERQREFLGYAYLSTQQLTTLVEDILLISKADSGQFILRTAEMDPATVVMQAIQAVQPAADKAEVTIAAELPTALPLVQADDLRIQQVLTNLLGNAIKFTPAGGAVTMAVAVGDDEVRFSVADTGKGVSPEDQARIFERFYQSEAATRHHSGGYGLGLAIAKLIVEQHGGRIWVESQAGQGASFSFTIPLRREERAPDMPR